MRKAIFVLAASIAFLACDSEQPTSPRTTVESSGAMSSQSRIGDASASAKPAPGPTYTVTTVKSAVVNFGASPNNFGYPSNGTISATCPAGTTLISGGYYVGNYDDTVLHIVASEPSGNAWTVKAIFPPSNPPYEAASLLVTAVCIQ